MSGHVVAQQPVCGADNEKGFSAAVQSIALCNSASPTTCLMSLTSLLQPIYVSDKSLEEHISDKSLLMSLREVSQRTRQSTTPRDIASQCMHTPNFSARVETNPRAVLFDRG